MKNNNKLLSYDTIMAATKGDSEAMSEVTRYFGGYIARLSLRPISGADGTERYAVDENIRSELEAKLAAAVLHFKAA